MSLDNAKARAKNQIIGGEGFAAHMYLDSVSYVTIGYGHLLPSPASTHELSMFTVTGRTALASEKDAEWKRLRAISATGKPRNYSAASYTKGARLFITKTEGLRLFNLKLDGFLKSLRIYYPRFDSFPEDAQVALLDMIYNLGPKIKTSFVQFSAAINNSNGPDWEKAAQQSHRPQLGIKRNQEVRDLFLAAKKASAAKTAKATH